MKLKLTVAAAIAAVAGIASAQDMVVKIGHVAPMSGAQAHYGKDNENGVRMAIEDLNAQGVTIGGKKVKFEIQPKTTPPIRSRARLLHRNCATPRSPAWSAT
jgi:branched-chain amino acid transport system substrate-binding protein